MGQYECIGPASGARRRHSAISEAIVDLQEWAGRKDLLAQGTEMDRVVLRPLLGLV